MRTLFHRIAAPLLAALCLSAPQTWAAATQCPAMFAQGAAPDVLQANIAQKTRPLCFESYSVLYSGIALAPLWSAEHLTRANLVKAHALTRVDHFHEEPLLKDMPHATLADFSRSGFDRGHMSPNGDMPDTTAQFQSFSLANMVAQSPPNNRGVWAGIEAAARDIASKDGEAYVVTGPIFEGSSLQKLKGHVLVPTFLFKAIYSPQRQLAGAWIVPNAPGSDYKVVTLAQLSQRAHIDPFPTLGAAIKAKAWALPAPTESHHVSVSNAKTNKVQPDQSTDQSLTDWFQYELMRMLKQINKAL
ncbi:DNA/RNA non-specific endonuclease [Amantichitinum ursilacus]|uniref:Endonuclease n=1 Tax=Amantichitinum ursilacus TaxID=857265 RepID=A0A0N1JRA0_9NEIS|nr:DNA/RNA non-specific endonuclease [Amantichitinum ursilacus]KPC49099.1 Nuclease precursor [Amantichitinum ursilacus]